jgi:beta-lactamase regulating signal transducer with metallopeptidase domain
MTGLVLMALKASVVLAATLAALRPLRRRSAALRHWLLVVGIACAAATPALALIAPVWHPPLGLTSGAPPQTATAGATVRPAVDVAAVSASAVAPRSAAPTLTAPHLTVAQWLGLMWGAGSAISLLVLFAGLARLTWLASGSRQMRDGMWPSIAAEVALAYGLRRDVLLLYTDDPSHLFTWGFLRPVVVLPRDAPGWSVVRARIVLRHELAHVRRGDWLAQMGAEIVRAVYWFNPLAWLVSRRLRDESERACDDQVMSDGLDGSEYATELVALARLLNAGRRDWVLAPAMARRSSLERRISAMLNADINRRPIARASRVLVGSSLLVLALLVGGFTLSAQTFASFAGSVLDQTGGIVPGVTLALTNTQTGQKYEVKSSDVGTFEFVGLTSGEYELETSMPGFRDAKSSLTIGGKDLRGDIHLEVGSLEETITVAGSREPRLNVSAGPRVRAGDPPKQAECVVRSAGGVIKPPRKIADARPVSPGKAGLIVLDALIGIDGTIREARPADANADPDLAASAIEAVKLWQYTPTLLNCVPVEVQMKVTVNFTVQ